MAFIGSDRYYQWQVLPEDWGNLMRKISYLIVTTVLIWLLFLVCIYVLFTAPQLGYFIEGGPTDWISENYGQLGLFLGGVSLVLLLVALMNTFFLISNVRISMRPIESEAQLAREKPKTQPEKRVDAVLASLSEDEITELHDLLFSQEDEQSLLNRNLNQ